MKKVRLCVKTARRTHELWVTEEQAQAALTDNSDPNWLQIDDYVFNRHRIERVYLWGHSCE